jgi:hypothetical protein
MGRRAPGGDGQETEMKIEVGRFGFGRAIKLQSAMRRFLALFIAISAVAPALAWEHWGGDAGGMRFSPLAQITPADVGRAGDSSARQSR